MVFTANHLTDTDKQNSKENTDKQTQYKSEKVDNLKYSKTKLPWFSCLLQHSARKRDGLVLQRSRAHTGRPTQQALHGAGEWRVNGKQSGGDGNSSCGMVGWSGYGDEFYRPAARIHTYIQTYIAPTVARTNLRRLHYGQPGHGHVVITVGVTCR